MLQKIHWIETCVAATPQNSLTQHNTKPLCGMNSLRQQIYVWLKMTTHRKNTRDKSHEFWTHSLQLNECKNREQPDRKKRPKCSSPLHKHKSDKFFSDSKEFKSSVGQPLRRENWKVKRAAAVHVFRASSNLSFPLQGLSEKCKVQVLSRAVLPSSKVLSLHCLLASYEYHASPQQYFSTEAGSE